MPPTKVPIPSESTFLTSSYVTVPPTEILPVNVAVPPTDILPPTVKSVSYTHLTLPTKA